MLLAEIHCKIVREALDNEDYITSAVFGHLRYIPPVPSGLRCSHGLGEPVRICPASPRGFQNKGST